MDEDWFSASEVSPKHSKTKYSLRRERAVPTKLPVISRHSKMPIKGDEAVKKSVPISPTLNKKSVPVPPNQNKKSVPVSPTQNKYSDTSEEECDEWLQRYQQRLAESLLKKSDRQANVTESLWEEEEEEMFSSDSELSELPKFEDELLDEDLQEIILTEEIDHLVPKFEENMSDEDLIDISESEEMNKSFIDKVNEWFLDDVRLEDM